MDASGFAFWACLFRFTLLLLVVIGLLINVHCMFELVFWVGSYGVWLIVLICGGWLLRSVVVNCCAIDCAWYLYYNCLLIECCFASCFFCWMFVCVFVICFDCLVCATAFEVGCFVIVVLLWFWCLCIDAYCLWLIWFMHFFLLWI